MNVLVLTLPISKGGAHDAARLPGVEDDAMGGSNLEGEVTEPFLVLHHRGAAPKCHRGGHCSG